MSPMQKETPLAATGGASCDSFGGLSHDCSSLDAHRAQFLILSHSLRPEMAVAIANMVFSGGAQ